MKVTIYEGTAEEIKELLPTIVSSQEQENKYLYGTRDWKKETSRATGCNPD